MLNRKSNNAKKKKWLIGGGVLMILTAVAITTIMYFTSVSLVGRWELINMRATPERIDSLPAAQQSTLDRYFSERLENESMVIEFNDDGTGMMILTINSETESHQFRWNTENGILTQRIGILSMDNEYSFSCNNLTLTNNSEDDGIIREFRRIKK